MFRFTIRDALWLSVVVIMWMAWAFDRCNLMKHYEAAKIAAHERHSK
jgi:hypothetical protein